MQQGNELSSLFVLNNYKNRRASSYDPAGGNHDWWDFNPGETRAIADIEGCGVIRHIWCTHYAQNEGDAKPEEGTLSKIILRIYWDDEQQPSVLAPLGDFFGMGFGLARNFTNAAFSFSPQDGRAMSCYLPMPFKKAARIEIENLCETHLNFYFYVDYELHPEGSLGPDVGYLHAQHRREAKTRPTAPVRPGSLETDKANDPAHPFWYPKAWIANNTTGEENYVILEAEGRGKYVGCNLNINVTERQTNDWYGEGDDMIFIDGDPLPTLHGTGTEDYFGTAFCPKQEFYAPYHGITRYSGEEFPYSGANCMYRLHVADPIHFEKSIRVTIEHGHNNKLANEYTSTAYWYQAEPHKPFSLP